MASSRTPPVLFFADDTKAALALRSQLAALDVPLTNVSRSDGREKLMSSGTIIFPNHALLDKNKDWLRETFLAVGRRRPGPDGALSDLLPDRLAVAVPAGADFESVRRLFADFPNDVSRPNVERIDDPAEWAKQKSPHFMRCRAQLAFVSDIRTKLERWRRVMSPVQLSAARNQYLTTLMWEVEAAAAADCRPTKWGAAAVEWCEYVFAAVAYLKQLDFSPKGVGRPAAVTPPADGARPNVDLAPGLLIAILVEIWAHALGAGDDKPFAGPAGDSSLCVITYCDNKQEEIQLSFAPLPGSSLKDLLVTKAPSPGFKDSLLCLERMGCCHIGLETFDLRFPVLTPAPTADK